MNGATEEAAMVMPQTPDDPNEFAPEGYSPVLIYHGTNPFRLFQCDRCGVLISSNDIHEPVCPGRERTHDERRAELRNNSVWATRVQQLEALLRHAENRLTWAQQAWEQMGIGPTIIRGAQQELAAPGGSRFSVDRRSWEAFERALLKPMTKEQAIRAADPLTREQAYRCPRCEDPRRGDVSHNYGPGCGVLRPST